MVDAQIRLERVRRDAVLLSEPADELEPAEAGDAREFVQRDPLVPAFGQVMPGSPNRRVLGALASPRRRPWAQMRAQRRDRAEDRLVDREVACGLGGERRVGTLERRAQRDVAEHHPAGRAGRATVALGPVVHEPRLDVQDLVRPPLGDRGHARVDRLGLEYE